MYFVIRKVRTIKTFTILEMGTCSNLFRTEQWAEAIKRNLKLSQLAAEIKLNTSLDQFIIILLFPGRISFSFNIRDC